MPAVSPLLTIAIPTYNRSRYLERLLETLADQISPDSLVELIVSDNASSDDTHEVVERFQSCGLRIRYLKNETNRGPDLNILQCYEEAAGKYVWILGDDDFVRPGGLSKVISHIRDEEYDLVYVASVGFTESSVPSSAVQSVGVEVFEDAEILARRVNIFFTFISGNIVNKARTSSVAHRPFSELAGSYLIQLGWIYAAVDHHRRSLVINDPVVAALTGNTGGYRLFQVFGPNLKRITVDRIRSEHVRRAVLNGALQHFFPPFILAQRSAKGSFASEDPHLVLASTFGDNFRYWFFNYPIEWMPRILARCWLVLVRAVNRVDRMLGFPLLGL